MAYYKAVYANSKMWDGNEPLDGKRVIVYCEQGYGDIIQFSRYFKLLKERGCHVTAHCPKTLHRLLAGLADDFIDKDEIIELPPHDFHILSLNLPFELKEVAYKPDPGYLNVSEVADLEEYAGHFKIGIAWEGSVNHSNNADRSCPLEYFAPLAMIPNAKLFMIQNGIHNTALIKNCDNLPLFGVPLDDFYDTAKLINAMDMIISVDTSVLHLAGALNKKTYGLLSYRHDPRWKVNDWYPSVKLIRQNRHGNWDSVFDAVFKDMGIVGRVHISPPPNATKMLFTGGIGDVMALECFMTDEERENLRKIYWATRACNSIRPMFDILYPAAEQEVLWTNQYEELFAFHSKAEASQEFDVLPEDWPEVSDWSIGCKFDEITDGQRTYNGCSLMHKALISQSDFWAFKLPENYVVIAPRSGNDFMMERRDFDSDDWLATLEYLEKHNLVGVVLNNERDVYIDERLINLTGQTSLMESLEILARSSGYIGIDSCLSVLGAKLDGHLLVKSRNKHLYRNQHIYYAPRTDFGFIAPEIRKAAERLAQRPSGAAPVTSSS
jgi:ADP-heptose:LPS heptosyltransferase